VSHVSPLRHGIEFSIVHTPWAVGSAFDPVLKAVILSKAMDLALALAFALAFDFALVIKFVILTLSVANGEGPLAVDLDLDLNRYPENKCP
jgi:hypothetical protein